MVGANRLVLASSLCYAPMTNTNMMHDLASSLGPAFRAPQDHVPKARDAEPSTLNAARNPVRPERGHAMSLSQCQIWLD